MFCFVLIVVCARILFSSKWNALIGVRSSSIFWSFYAFLGTLVIFMWHTIYMQNAKALFIRFNNQLSQEKLSPFASGLNCSLDLNSGLLVGFSCGLFIAVVSYIFGNSGLRQKGLIHVITKKWLRLSNISEESCPNYYGVTLMLLFFGTFLIPFEIVAWLVDTHLAVGGAEFVWALTFAGITGVSAFLRCTYPTKLGRILKSKNDELRLLELENKNSTEILHLATYGSLIVFLSFFAAGYINWIASIDPVITSTNEYNMIGFSTIILYLLIITGLWFGIVYPALLHNKAIQERLKRVLQEIQGTDIKNSKHS
jgi:hypothetical protein